MIGGLGIWELLIILFIVLIIFGAGKLPEIGSGLGKGIASFKRATKESNEIDVTQEKTSQTAKSEDDSGDTPSS